VPTIEITSEAYALLEKRRKARRVSSSKLIVEALHAMDEQAIAEHPLTVRLEQGETEAPEPDETSILERIQRDRALGRRLVTSDRASEIAAVERTKRR
jgi:hypothetical protein